MPILRVPTDRRALSRRLHAVLYSLPVFALIAPYQCGWSDGGCAIAADGIVRWLGPGAQVWTLINEQGRPQHLLARFGTWYLDGDGVSTSDELRERWANLELIPRGRLRRALSDDLPQTPKDPKTARQLAGLLEARLPASLVRQLLAK